jgi:hypothetical protein
MRNKRVVWIVTHFEYLGPPCWLDECVMFVAASQASARRMIQRSFVDPGTWWGVRAYEVDALDAERGPGVLYSRSGVVMKRGLTLKQALRERRRAEKKKGGTKLPPSRPC